MNDSQPQSLLILGIPFHLLSFDEVLRWCNKRIRQGKPSYIVTANFDYLVQARLDPALRKIILDADLVTCDGMPVVWLSSLLGPALKERIAGSDLIPKLGKLAHEFGYSIFALGSAPGVADSALKKLKATLPDLKIAGTLSPSQAELQTRSAEIAQAIRKAAPQVLIVSLGCPKQEKWISANYQNLGVPISIGVGASLDFLAGAKKRAPLGIQKLGLEWLWRMLTEPSRLGMRYIIDIVYLFYFLTRLTIIRWLSLPSLDKLTQFNTAALETKSIFLASIDRLDPKDIQPFRDKVLLQLQSHHILLDLRKRAWLNSRELGTLLRLHQDALRHEKKFFLGNVHRRVARLLRFYKLQDYFCILSSDADLTLETHPDAALAHTA